MIVRAPITPHPRTHRAARSVFRCPLEIGRSGRIEAAKPSALNELEKFRRQSALPENWNIWAIVFLTNLNEIISVTEAAASLREA
jgi:hypothetical protein